jgi:cytoplasmic iron level regulating protein YaaA (DUF328/UPF0246 family)
MIILMSPAKTFSKTKNSGLSHPYFLNDTQSLVKKLKKLKINDLENMLNISKNLAIDTYQMYQNFDQEKYAAIYLYDGQAFRGLDIYSFNKDQLTYLNDHLYILSGLYGILKPLDNISKYRLDIKDHILNNLYHYWSKKIDLYLNQYHSDELIINLASNEYSRVLNKNKNIITIDFAQEVNGKTKSISMHTKLARGMMVNQLIKLRINKIDDIKKISFDGYYYNEYLSSESKLIFLKKVTFKK